MGGKVLEYEAKSIRREGIGQGIRGIVSILKNLGMSSQEILKEIQKQYHLSQEESKKYL